ncbi:hypothetical protein GCM10011584_09580 [Nocardioides phosphati]|uniref:Uncharacterized protein n=1 Tax=Nocardioides phosphati TaxID=1867775 RepID=A0ABQ2N6X6_9ACTN|nr:hypothetical protein [Nocardioides phosphati]GGO86682.1 hypothetical protein GCM10011584_09580 [Nocardioides phosphati]
MTVRVHCSTHGTYWRWTCDTCDLWDSAGDWDEAMEAATGHAVYRHARPAIKYVLPTWNPLDGLPVIDHRPLWIDPDRPMRVTCKADQ